LASIGFSRTTYRQKTVGYKSFSNPRAYFFILIFQPLEKKKPELASKLRLSLRRYGCSEKLLTVTPAKAGAQEFRRFWIPACAGMTSFPEFP
jgi:hypothetical protein